MRLAVILTALIAAVPAHAASAQRTRVSEAAATRPAGEPLLAIVSLHSQKVTVYDADGWILRAPVSSGQGGRETPSGVFSVIQKNAEHYSNLYDDAYMPHMQRITWSGIALHGGALPGYPASHGCVRLPFDFAARLFDMTKMGMRVIVAPRDAEPVEISHPTLFNAKSGAGAVAAQRAAEAAEATKQAEQARTAALAATREVARASMPVRTAENLKQRATTELAAVEAALTNAATPEAKQQFEERKTRLAARVAELDGQIDAAKTELQPKLDAAAPLRDAVVAAEAARVEAAKAAADAARELEPVSVFISRKSQKLYVRRASQPIFDSPVTIADADRPIGTHVFTATARGGGDELRWNVVSLDGQSARPALDRITIPQEALDRIAGMGVPRSSVIVSDEEMSRETAKDTDFIVILSNEPQGGIKSRPRPNYEARYDSFGVGGRMQNWRPPSGGTFYSIR